MRGHSAAASTDAGRLPGYTGRGTATVSELAEFLQERHNSVVGLVERAAQRGLVRKEHDKDDRRFVLVSLTAEGERILAALTELHKEEVQAAQRSADEDLEGPPHEVWK